MIEVAERIVVGLKAVGAGMAKVGVIGAGIGIGRYVNLGFVLTEARRLLAIMKAFLIMYNYE